MIGTQEAGPRTRSGVAIGTPGYMAVEQYEHADEVTAAADVYSLATMIWELVTGRRPWEHTDQALLYFQQRTVIPDRPPIDVMPADWADVLLRALSVDPSARPSARELAVALASALPAVGRVPSGAEILAALAPHFVRKAAPDDDTVRNASDVDRIGPLLWPPRETEPSGLKEPAHTRAEAAADARAPVLAAQARPPGGDEPPPAASAAMQTTTLSAATGVTSPKTERTGRWKLALAAIGTAGLAAVATGALATHTTASTASSPIPTPGGAREQPQGAKASAVQQASEATPAAPAAPSATPSEAPATSAQPTAVPETASPVSASPREPAGAARITTLNPVRASPPDDHAPRPAARAPHAPAPARAAATLEEGAPRPSQRQSMNTGNPSAKPKPRQPSARRNSCPRSLAV
jgi:hypothetical protein